MPREPLPEHPAFVRLHAGRVHVVDNSTTAVLRPEDLADPALVEHHAAAAGQATVRLSQVAPVTMLDHYLGVVKTRCGRRIVRHRGGLEESGSFVGTFDDEDLCRACYDTVAADETGRLFEHDQEDPS